MPDPALDTALGVAVAERARQKTDPIEFAHRWRLVLTPTEIDRISSSPIPRQVHIPSVPEPIPPPVPEVSPNTPLPTTPLGIAALTHAKMAVSNSWRVIARQILQLVFAAEAVVVTLISLPGLGFALYATIVAVGSPGSKYVGGTGIILVLISIVSMATLGALHIFSVFKGVFHFGILWIATLLHALFCYGATMACTHNPLWFTNKAYWIFTVTLSFNILISIAGLMLTVEGN
jgi:hypothetical protein